MAQKETFLMFGKKIIIPLLAVVLLSGALFAVTMIDGDNKDEVVTDSASSDTSYEVNYVLDVEAQNISKINVSLSDESFEFSKTDSTWNSSGATKARVSSGSVSVLASSIADLSYDEVITDGSISASDCGITDESDTVSFLSDLGEVSLRKGMTTTDGSLCYIMTSLSDNVYLCSTQEAARIFAPLKTYRHSASVNLDFENITSISYSGKEKMELVKTDVDSSNAVYNSWRLTSPVSIGANDEAVNKKFVEPISQIKVKDFASDSGNYADYGLGGLANFVKLTDSSGKASTVYFSYETGGKYYICVDDEATIYEISLSDAPYINLGVIDIADRNINLAKMTNISNVTLTGGEYNYNVEFGEKSGKINGTEVSYDVMNQTVFPGVCGLMADDIYLGEAAETKITLSYMYKDGKSDTVAFSDYNDRYYAVSKNGKTGYLILKSKVSDLALVLEKLAKEN